MNLNDLLYNEQYAGCVQFNDESERSFKRLEIWIYEDSDEPFIVESNLQRNDLEDWLHQRDTYMVPVNSNGKKAIGLRLLVQQWRMSMKDGRVLLKIPFNKQRLADIISPLHLPQSYLHCLAGRLSVPTQLQKVITQAGVNLGITSQSPFFNDQFMTSAVSYDPQQNITSGFLGYGSNARRSNDLDPLLSNVRRAAIYAFHPMLLPIFIQRYWCSELHELQTSAIKALWNIQFETGQMKNFFHKHFARDSNPELVDFNEIHARIVEEHTYLTNVLPSFVEQVDANLLRALDEVDDEWLCSNRTSTATRHKDLRKFTLQLQLMVQDKLRRKDRILNQLDMQLKVLYSLMQQRDSRINYKIAVEARRDSSVMKSIAIVTMFFLPGTAVATIFSMSSFFTSDSHSELTVSKQFYIYWIVTIPLTILVLGCFLLWLKRNSLRTRQTKGDKFSSEKEDETGQTDQI